MADPITDQITQLATDGIAESEGDGHRVKAQPIPDLIEADKYVAAKNAAAQKTFGLRFVRLVPPGTVS